MILASAGEQIGGDKDGAFLAAGGGRGNTLGASAMDWGRSDCDGDQSLGCWHYARGSNYVGGGGTGVESLGGAGAELFYMLRPKGPGLSSLARARVSFMFCRREGPGLRA